MGLTPCLRPNCFGYNWLDMISNIISPYFTFLVDFELEIIPGLHCRCTPGFFTVLDILAVGRQTSNASRIKGSNIMW